MLFAVVLVLSLWLARHVEHDAVRRFAEAGDGGQEILQQEAQTSGRVEHSHPAFGQRTEERREMVAQQVEARKIVDANVIRAMVTVPRHAFIPQAQQRYAYADGPVPIGEGQTISQPYIVALMTEALALDSSSKVLEVGTGSGYQAAVCAEIADEVYTIEIVPSLAKTAAETLNALGYWNVFVKTGDGYYGWPEQGPFDAIIGTAAADRIPPGLVEQLALGGRMIFPCADTEGYTYLILVTKDDEARLSEEKVLPVRFVPMTGCVLEPEDD